MIEDRLLILKCKRGSTDALRRIYQKYKDDLLVLATAILNDTSAAEDVLHDVFVAFVGALKKFKLTGSLKAYLATCVANRARNLNRQRHNRNVGLDHANPAGSDSDQPHQAIVCNEQSQRLNAAMAELPYEQRDVIMLHLRTGLTFRQIAKSQAVSVDTVKSRYRYGIEKLRKILKKER
ncbi:MAG: RNA polymerase sigma factor [Planctomycetota bacterium]|jgi:RNA polymerase sigma-70 factor (ECF subfamily)